MSDYMLQNQELAIRVASHGAELVSLRDVRTGTEYMWGADPAYWKRTSPILFPLVGAYRNNETIYQGKRYSLPQHGFARDMEFVMDGQTEDSLSFLLTDDGQTRENYPFAFRLGISYRLRGRTLTVGWRVENPSDGEMYFSIGGHPAFNCPLRAGERQTDYALLFDAKDKVTSRRLGKSGVTDIFTDYALQGGKLAITEDLFDHDALIIEGNQAHEVSLVDPSGKAYLTVSFDAPLFGIWSPPQKNAPFVCIEPWYGRADHENFTGELPDRAWGNTLAPHGVFEASYGVAV